ncbi:MAG: ATP-binding protein [Deltaproteobacteria bacterium]|nr:ATP-binding protein [Deltaproteobacteria bacterium]
MLPKEKTPPKKSLSDLSILAYGPSKIGKSSWCSHAPNALFLATEPGLNHLDVYQSPITTWEELLAACMEIAKGDHPFQTIIIDTIDNAYRMCEKFICDKHNISHESDFGYGKGYALVNNEFQRVILKLAQFPYGLFLVSHSKMTEIETRTGKRSRIVPTLPNKASEFILGLVDIILFCDQDIMQEPNASPVVRRVMRTKPHPNYEAGDRTDRLPALIDLDFSKFLAAFNGSEANSTGPTPTDKQKPEKNKADAARPTETKPQTTKKGATR